jgi:hypothetical protein
VIYAKLFFFALMLVGSGLLAVLIVRTGLLQHFFVASSIAVALLGALAGCCSVLLAGYWKQLKSRQFD